MSNGDLQKLLNEMTQIGHLESRGKFPMDHAAAWRKRGAFKLPFPGAWVLKIAQSAQKAAASLEIRQDRSKTEFLYGSDWLFSRNELRAALLSPGGGTSPSALDHLGAGLRALAQSELLPFSIEYHDGTADLWDGHSLLTVREHEPSRCDGFRLTVSHYQSGETSTLSSLLHRQPLERAARIARLVSSHCCWGVSPIRLDGRPLNDFLLDPDFGVGSMRQPLLLLRAEASATHPRMRFVASSRVLQLGAKSGLVSPRGSLEGSTGDTLSRGRASHRFLRSRRGVPGLFREPQQELPCSVAR